MRLLLAVLAALTHLLAGLGHADPRVPDRASRSGARAALDPYPPDSDFDRIAGCESGGDWSINTHNGYSGGLQFTAGTWAAYGGNRFAVFAYQATRAEQILVARRVEHAQGWAAAWPYCSLKEGLR